MAKILYLIRHAQSHPSETTPDPEWPLSARGRAQAERLAEVLAALGIEEVHTSPYLRCRDTVAPFLAACPLPVHQHHDLRERKIAHGYIDDFPVVWRRSWEDFTFALPECESSHATQERVHAAVVAICERSTATTMAVSSHGNAISLLLHRLDARFHFERASAIRNPDLFRITYEAGTLRWDEDFRSPDLDAFATHHDETPFPRRNR